MPPTCLIIYLFFAVFWVFMDVSNSGGRWLIKSLSMIVRYQFFLFVDCRPKASLFVNLEIRLNNQLILL